MTLDLRTHVCEAASQIRVSAQAAVSVSAESSVSTYRTVTHSATTPETSTATLHVVDENAIYVKEIQAGERCASEGPKATDV